MNLRATRLGVIAALLAVAGCAKSTLTAKEAGGAKHVGSDAGSQDAAPSPDAGRRVKERTVFLEVPPIATRDLTQGADGEPVYGAIQPLDGATVCIVQRREAFAPFMPFDKVDPPICAKSVAGKAVRIEGAPANSDLVITVESEGLRPLALTGQTGASDTGNGWAPVFSLILLKPGATDPWLDISPPPGPGDGVVVTGAAVSWSGSGNARPELIGDKDVYFGTASGWAIGAGIPEVIEPAGGGAPIATKTLPWLRAVSLPEGSARFKFTPDNEHVTGCAAPGTYVGLTAAADSWEMPVLAGHDHLVGVLCNCGGVSASEELLDLGRCTFASAGAAGSDAGGP